MTSPTPPRVAPASGLQPFAQQPGHWEQQRTRAWRTGHLCCGTWCTQTCEPVLIRERTCWGFVDWPVPAGDCLPERAHCIGVLTPAATRVQRLALRWLSRRPAQRLPLLPVSVRCSAAAVSVHCSAAAVAVLGLVAAAAAISHGTPIGVAVPLMPLLTEHVPDRLDARAGEHVRTVEGEAACRYLQHLAGLHNHLIQAAADSDLDQARRAAEIGRHQLWDAAGLLIHHDTRAVSAELIARERLLVQLAALVTDLHSPTDPGSAPGGRPAVPAPQLGPYPPGFRRQSDLPTMRTDTIADEGTRDFTRSTQPMTAQVRGVSARRAGGVLVGPSDGEVDAHVPDDQPLGIGIGFGLEPGDYPGPCAVTLPVAEVPRSPDRASRPQGSNLRPRRMPST
ncbi:hypothetical protein ACFTY7_06660 [Streptomyces sp. NPDC057062]|uniref:hypothetical protein n=1 Tax=Streptomyces sp. NPDC057062 TaxID=3346011 RepID=UPI00362FE142